MARGLKLREVAAAIDVAQSTYGNVEASPHRVISDARVVRLAEFFKLTGGDRDRFIEAAAQLPLSEYTTAQREKWQKRNELRSKSRRFDLMFEAIDNLACMLAAEGRPCECAPAVPEDFDSPARAEVVCPLCKALRAIGIPEGYGSPDLGLQRIAALHSKLEAQRTAVANG